MLGDPAPDPGADLDICLFAGGLRGADCVSKEHQAPEAELQAGTWYIVIEAFQSETQLLSGEYVLAIDSG